MSGQGFKRFPRLRRLNDLDQLDFVELMLANYPARIATVAAGLGAETRGVFDREIFSAMKPGASFHAVSRGSVIDFPALEEALQSGRLAFAGLDVCDREPLAQESPLWEMPNVLLTSHSAGWSPQLAGRLCDLFAENLQDIRHDRPLKNIISLR
jgi:phosphoglycerate dehydrogenase-like enzyme